MILDKSQSPKLLAYDSRDNWDYKAFRRQFAADALIVMLESGGNRSDKVHAAVDYANQLTDALLKLEHEKRLELERALTRVVEKKP